MPTMPYPVESLTLSVIPPGDELGKRTGRPALCLDFSYYVEDVMRYIVSMIVTVLTFATSYGQCVNGKCQITRAPVQQSSISSYQFAPQGAPKAMPSTAGQSAVVNGGSSQKNQTYSSFSSMSRTITSSTPIVVVKQRRGFIGRLFGR